MHIKSYFGVTVAAAVEQARRELGPDALIVNSREAPPEAARLGRYEVVFGVDAEPAAAPAVAHVALSPELLHRELRDLRKQMEEFRTSLRGRAVDPDPASLSPDIYQTLLEREIDAELAGVILRSLQKRIGTRQGSALWDLLPEELESRLIVDSELPVDCEKCGAVALIGPPGAGKTTTLVKLALTHGLRARRPVQFLSLDTVRIAAAEQLRTYAAILGVGFQIVETMRGLDQALEEHRNKGLILIDTAGYTAAGMADAQDLARHLAGHSGIETHLVLPASMKPADLNRALERFDIFGPSKLIFTKMDETESHGAIFCASVRSGLPISFLANGQSIPEDIEPADKAALVDLILPDRMRRVESAA